MKLIAALCLVGAAAAGSVKCNVLNADGSLCKGTCTTNTTSPVKGQNFTITAIGMCSEDVTAANYHVDGKFAGLPVINEDCADACKPYDFKIGGALNMGHMYIAGAGCPVKQGTNMTIVSTAYVGANAPGGTLTSEMKAYDGNKQLLLDLQIITSL